MKRRTPKNYFCLVRIPGRSDLKKDHFPPFTFFVALVEVLVLSHRSVKYLSDEGLVAHLGDADTGKIECRIEDVGAMLRAFHPGLDRGLREILGPERAGADHLHGADVLAVGAIVSAGNFTHHVANDEVALSVSVRKVSAMGHVAGTRAGDTSKVRVRPKG